MKEFQRCSDVGGRHIGGFDKAGFKKLKLVVLNDARGLLIYIFNFWVLQSKWEPR